MKTLKSFIVTTLLILFSLTFAWAGTPVYCNDGGSNTFPYETWAKAATTLTTALGAVDAGGTIYIQSDHAEVLGGDTTYISTNGVAGSPVTIISINGTANEPPIAGEYQTMVAGGGSIDAGVGFDLNFTGWDIWVGMDFVAQDNLLIGTNDTDIMFIDTKFSVDDNLTIDTGANDTIAIFKDVDIVQVTAGGYFNVKGSLYWRGGSFVFGGGDISTSFILLSATTGAEVTLEDVDIQSLDAGDYLVSDTNNNHRVLFKRCKVPAAIVDNDNYMNAGPTGRASEVKFHSVSDNDNIFSFKEYYYEGSIESDATVYLDATYDGTNGYSAKMVADKTNTTEWTEPLRFKLAEIYVTATGKTLTVEVLTDNVTLQNDEFWLEVEYPDSTIAAFGNILSTRSADILATPANLTASAKGAGDWTGESGTPVYQKIVADFTGVADEAIGVYTVWANLAKETTVYVDPKIVVATP